MPPLSVSHPHDSFIVVGWASRVERDLRRLYLLPRIPLHHPQRSLYLLPAIAPSGKLPLKTDPGNCPGFTRY